MHGFTLTEMVVVIVVISIMAALLFPAIKSVRQQALSAACLGNVRTMLTVHRTMFIDNGDILPGSAIIYTPYSYDSALIPQYLPAELRCPLVTSQFYPLSTGFRYAFNDSLRIYFPRLVLPVSSDRVVAVSEMYYMNSGFWSVTHLDMTMQGMANSGIQISPQSHFGGLNMGFLDGHAERVTAPTNSLGQVDWSASPVFAHNLTQGLYYSVDQFVYIKIGESSW